jgi:alpha-beta hydrolase superfamily lysophospholipase
MTVKHTTDGLLAAVFLVLLQGCSSVPLEPWHTEKLSEEFTAAKTDEVQTFDDYLKLEDRLFAELEEEIIAQVETGPEYGLVRYSSGSASDPQHYQQNWNRSFELRSDVPAGGVLLLHGMSDSPYSLRALAETLSERGYWVIGLRMPGHGTAPSGLKYVQQPDMIAAVRIAMAHLSSAVGDKPVHVIGYSTGAALALDFSLDAAEGLATPMPASLVLISPALRVHGTAALAGFKSGLGRVPGLGGLTWLSVLPEFDPYKYNSFATNAGDVVHRLTRSVDRRLAARSGKNTKSMLPPILAFKSTVDATVTTEAVVDNLLALLTPNRHELVLFDINRHAAKSSLLVSDPGPLTNRLLADGSLPFGITFVANKNPDTNAVVTLYKTPFSDEVVEADLPNLAWPPGVFSLSHVALPFPPDDPLYGPDPPDDSDIIRLGDIAVRGERDLLKLPGDWLLRMRYNPFYEVLETRALEWLEKSGEANR